MDCRANNAPEEEEEGGKNESVKPSVETVGYSRASLRDIGIGKSHANRIRLQCYVFLLVRVGRLATARRERTKLSARVAAEGSI